jgi:hypothetical protein
LTFTTMSLARSLDTHLARRLGRLPPCLHLPAEDASQRTGLRLELGVFGGRPENRVDVLDLFLAGLGLTQ